MTLAERLRAAATANRLAEHVTIDRRWNGVRFKRERQDLFRVIEVDGQWVQSLCGMGCCFDTDELKPTREAAIRAGLLALADREEAAP